MTVQHKLLRRKIGQQYVKIVRLLYIFARCKTFFVSATIAIVSCTLRSMLSIMSPYKDSRENSNISHNVGLFPKNKRLYLGISPSVPGSIRKYFRKKVDFKRG